MRFHRSKGAPKLQANMWIIPALVTVTLVITIQALNQNVPALFVITYGAFATATGYTLGNALKKTRTVPEIVIVTKKFDEAEQKYRQMVEQYFNLAEEEKQTKTKTWSAFMAAYSKAKMEREHHQGKMPTLNSKAWTYVTLVKEMEESLQKLTTQSADLTETPQVRQPPQTPQPLPTQPKTHKKTPV